MLSSLKWFQVFRHSTGNILNHLKLSIIVSSHLRLSKIIWYYLKLSDIIFFISLCTLMYDDSYMLLKPILNFENDKWWLTISRLSSTNYIKSNQIVIIETLDQIPANKFTVLHALFWNIHPTLPTFFYNIPIYSSPPIFLTIDLNQYNYDLSYFILSHLILSYLILYYLFLYHLISFYLNLSYLL